MRTVILFFLVCFAPFAHGQPGGQKALKGKTIAVYFSQRAFTFDDSYRIPLSQFVRSDQGADTDIENLKRQTLISLGTLFSEQLKAATDADSVFFMNEYPDHARAFMQSYDPDSHQLGGLGHLFAATDYVLVMNPLVLGSYKTSSVYSRSNRIITEQIMVMTARIRFELYDPQTGLLRHIHEACVDERKTRVPEVLFEFHMKYSRTGRFLARLFSKAVQHMNEGIKTNCEQ